MSSASSTACTMSEPRAVMADSSTPAATSSHWKITAAWAPEGDDEVTPLLLTTLAACCSVTEVAIADGAAAEWREPDGMGGVLVSKVDVADMTKLFTDRSLNLASTRRRFAWAA
ncbi:hypothetical protein KC19_10G125400 [Ceratodon purpureus]|uniref:Uncharacterized protein n=1 Tax=Ceratodon purpureus TaxID=3225 RepID=A0A8T0GJP7_CERPU|nr:hypothetical protein KC19_10G125400 [Ceratodon purpureus]